MALVQARTWLPRRHARWLDQPRPATAVPEAAPVTGHEAGGRHPCLVGGVQLRAPGLPRTGTAAPTAGGCDRICPAQRGRRARGLPGRCPASSPSRPDSLLPCSRIALSRGVV